jgi:4'-phosphopantetheinyl transferase EntD
MPPEALHLDVGACEGQFSRALGEAVRLAVAFEPLRDEGLTPAEREQAAAFGNADRRRDWARARAALKALLRQDGDDEDTAPLRFPHPRFSLSHSRDLAVAVGRGAARPWGIGVDVERQRLIRPGAERFYLDERERAWLGSVAGDDARGGARLRLWTVKEALYKAHLGNAGTVLADYRVQEPAAEAGAGGVRGEAGWPLRYATAAVPDGFLTVALRVSARPVEDDRRAPAAPASS